VLPQTASLEAPTQASLPPLPDGLQNPFVRLLISLYALEKDQDPTYTRARFADKLGVVKSVITCTFTGKAQPGAALIQRTCRAYPAYGSEIARALAKCARPANDASSQAEQTEAAA
jgi:hypothetical protein